VKEEYGSNLQIDWQPFSLEQANSKEGPNWKVWDQPDALLALRAGEAAKRQGLEAFAEFHMALLKAYHEDRKDLAEEATVMDAAKSSGLDLDTFRRDLADKVLFRDISKSHTEASEQLGVFGVPTYVFPNGVSAFLKTYKPKDEEAVEMFENLHYVMTNWAYVGEMKRPQPPWPKGVFPQK
jgi:predicted DsbA family dithiol-disulfide isomerase